MKTAQISRFSLFHLISSVLIVAIGLIGFLIWISNTIVNIGLFNNPNHQYGANLTIPPINKAQDFDIDTILYESAKLINFEENKGQLPNEFFFKIDAAQYSIRFLKDKISFVVRNNTGTEGLVWNIAFAGTNPDLHIKGKGKKQTKVNYLKDNVFREVPAFREVWYENIYKDIDLRFYTKNDGTVEYDFILYPGADVGGIQMKLEGIDDFCIDDNGEMVLTTPLGDFRKGAPFSYQNIEGKALKIESGYKIENNSIAFEVETYQAEYPLIIDPITLLASTLFPQNNARGRDAKVTEEGVFLTGYKYSNDNILVTPGVITPVPAGSNQGFVTKMSHDMTTVLFSTYICHPNNSWQIKPYAIDLDNDGNIYLSGIAVGHASAKSRVPTTINSFLSINPETNKTQTWVMKLDPDASRLIYGSYLGGRNGTTVVNQMCTFGGNIYLTGYTNAIDFPTTDGAWQENRLSSWNTFSGFFSIIIPDTLITDGSDLTYSTYVDGDDRNNLGARTLSEALHINEATGEIYVSGYTYSGDMYTTADAFYKYESINGTADVFLLEFDALANLGNGVNDLLYATGVGSGEANESCKAIHSTADGHVYLGISINGADADLPLVGNSFSADNSAKNNGYLAKVDVAASKVVAATYLNVYNASYSAISGIIEDDCGHLYVNGYLRSGILPIPADGFQLSSKGGYDVFILRFSQDLTNLLQGSFFGSSQNDYSWQRPILFDHKVYLAGAVTGGSSDFPTTPGVLYENNIQEHAFVSAFSTLLLQTTSDTVCVNTDTVLDGLLNVCGGEPPYNYLWTAGDATTLNSISNENTANPTVNISNNTTFTVQVTDALGAIDLDTVFIAIIPPNQFIDLGHNHHICNGDIQEIGNSNYAQSSYTWSVLSGDFASLDFVNVTEGIIRVSPGESTVYNLEYTDCGGVVSQDQITVYVEEDPANLINAGSDAEVCINGNMVLGDSAMVLENFEYAWVPEAYFNNPTLPQPIIDSFQMGQIGSYTLTMTNSCTGVSAEDEVVLILDSSSANAGPDTVGCTGISMVLNSRFNSLYTSYAWAFAATGTTSDNNGGNITNNTTASPSIRIYDIGIHEIVLTTTSVVCGTTSDTMFVLINQLPATEAGLDQVICVDYPDNISSLEMVTIGTQALYNYTYEWGRADGTSLNPGELNNNLIAQPTLDPNQWPPGAAAMTYQVTVTGACGNIVVDTMRATAYENTHNVDAYQSNDPANINEMTIACGGGLPLGMNGEPDIRYSWSPITNLIPYSDLYENINAPIVTASNVLDTITYYLTATDVCAGVSLVDSVTVIPACISDGSSDGGDGVPPFDPASLPIANAGENIYEVCGGTFVQLGVPDPSEGVWEYSWYPTTGLDNPNVAQPTFFGSNSTVYTLTVFNPNTGISDGDIVLIEVYGLPLANAGGNLFFACANEVTAQLGPPIGSTIFENPSWQYRWSPTTGLDNPYILRPTLTGPDLAYQYTISVTDTIGFCLASTAFINVIIGASTADAGPGTVLCPGSDVMIGAPAVAGLHYEWVPQDGLSNPFIAQPFAFPESTTTYQLFVTDSDGCVDIDEVMIYVTPTSTSPADAEIVNTAMCSTEPPFQIGNIPSQSPLADYLWTSDPADGALNGLNDATIAQPIIDPGQLMPGTTYNFYLQVTDVGTNCVSTDEFSLEIKPHDSPNIHISSNWEIACPGDLVTISNITITPASNDYDVLWASITDPDLNFLYPPDSESATIAVDDIAHTYTITVTNSCTGDTATGDINVTPAGVPEIISLGNYNSVCAGDPVSLDATTNGVSSLLWSVVVGGGTFNDPTIEDPVFTPAAHTMLQLEAQSFGMDWAYYNFENSMGDASGNGHDATGGTYPDYSSTAVSGSYSADFNGTSHGIQYSTGDNVTGWFHQDFTTLDVSFSFNPDNPGTGIQTLYDEGGATNGVIIRIENGVVKARAKEGANDVTLTSTVALAVGNWYSVSFSIDNTGLVELCVNDVCESGTNAALSPLAGHSNAGGLGMVFGVNAFGDSGAQYYDGLMDDVQIAFSSTDTPGGCPVYDYVVVPVDMPPALAGMDQFICANNITTVGTPGDSSNYNYAWSVVSGDFPSIVGATNTPVISVNPGIETVYEVSVTPILSGGCLPSTDQVTVFIIDEAPVADAGNDVTACAYDNVLLGGGSTYEEFSYLWTPTTGMNDPFSPNPVVSVSVTTTYTLVVTDCSGNTATDNVTITITPPPTVDAGNDIALCEREALYAQLGSSDDGYSYSWTPSAGLDDPSSATPVLTFPSDISDSYSATYTLSANDGNCTATDQVVVTFNPTPTLNYEDALICQADESIVLGDAGAIAGLNDFSGLSIVWLPNIYMEDNRIANPVVNPPQTMIYNIMVTTDEGCSTSQPVTVVVDDTSPDASATDACTVADGGGTATIEANEIPGATYTWAGPNGFVSNNAVHQLSGLTGADFGFYYVTVTADNNCEAIDSVELVNICLVNQNCNIGIDTMTISACNDQAEIIDLSITILWGEGVPYEMIEVIAGTSLTTIDATTLSSPQTVNLSVGYDIETVLVRFEESTSCAVTASFSYQDVGTYVVTDVICNDNNTATDLEDDLFYFTLTVNGQEGQEWRGLGQTGFFNESVLFGPFPISNGDISGAITYDFCNITIPVTVVAPDACSSETSCDIPYVLKEVFCCKNCPEGNIYLYTLNMEHYDVPTVQNLANNKVTQVSSRAFAERSNPAFAIDENTEGNSVLNPDLVVTASEENPWWQIDLTGNFDLTDLVVYGRTDCCASTVYDYTILVSNNDFTNFDLATSSAQLGVSAYSYSQTGGGDFTISVNRPGRFIRVYLNGTNQLQLAEVEVFGTSHSNTNPYTYTWSDPTIGNEPSPECMAPGTYQVTITDSGTGCTTVDNIVIN